MDDRFRVYVESLEPSCRRLVAMVPVRVTSLPPTLPEAGIYLFSEGEEHLYVGRSNRLRGRLQEHARPSSTHNSAPFAFRLAREEVGMTKASYVPKGSRADLESREDFRAAFAEAKERIRRMDVRFVEEQEPIRQALLEMYAAVCLQTPYNDFDTH